MDIRANKLNAIFPSWTLDGGILNAFRILIGKKLNFEQQHKCVQQKKYFELFKVLKVIKKYVHDVDCRMRKYKKNSYSFVLA